ncbi:MAG: hypothetical protein GVY20_17800 [Bacteroidetes bacterium]|jgi:hypothetical protein|nr:hypothetical protein [Bacteroidota bacterium]
MAFYKYEDERVNLNLVTNYKKIKNGIEFHFGNKYAIIFGIPKKDERERIMKEIDVLVDKE